VGKDGWIGVDLDGTLARYDGWKGPEHIGPPVPAMLERVKGWLEEGRTVKVFTARVAEPDRVERERVFFAIETWCREHLGRVIPITNVKDYGMVELYDDRAVTVEQNTGRLLGRVPEPPDVRGAPELPVSLSEWEAHWAFYRLTVDQRDRAWREVEELKARRAAGE
jgi:hypothetical protein